MISTMTSAVTLMRTTTAVRRRGLATPLVLVALLVFVALAAPWIAPYSPTAQPETITMRSLPPSLAHPFGTDANSRDVLSRVIHGARISLAVSALSVLVAVTLGVAFGAVAASVNRVVETFMMRTLDVLLALPRLLVLLAVTAFWSTLSVPALALLLGITGWYDIARLVHGETRMLQSRDFVLAASATGVGRTRVFLRHILPHLVPLLAVTASLATASTIALEAGISFLGLGIQEPQVSWGTIMHEGMGVVRSQWWLTVFPGVATLIAVIACNALGEGLRGVFAHNQLEP